VNDYWAVNPKRQDEEEKEKERAVEPGSFSFLRQCAPPTKKEGEGRENRPHSLVIRRKNRRGEKMIA